MFIGRKTELQQLNILYKRINSNVLSSMAADVSVKPLLLMNLSKIKRLFIYRY